MPSVGFFAPLLPPGGRAARAVLRARMRRRPYRVAPRPTRPKRATGAQKRRPLPNVPHCTLKQGSEVSRNRGFVAMRAPQNASSGGAPQRGTVPLPRARGTRR